MSLIVQKFGGSSVANAERVFNVADICVTVGMALFLIYFIFIERKEHRRFEIRQEIKRHEQ